MSRSIRKETSSFAFGMIGRFGGSSAGFVVATLNAASAASREVVVLRVLSADIVLSLALLCQIYSRRRLLQIHFRQCGHRCGGSRAKTGWRGVRRAKLVEAAAH